MCAELRNLKVVRYLVRAARSCLWALLGVPPNDEIFCRWRTSYWRRRNYQLGEGCVIYAGVILAGKVAMGQGCSISNNAFLYGADARIVLGDHVMIAPNCVFRF